MEDTQCLPCHSSHTLQGDGFEWEPEPGTRSRAYRGPTRVGSQTNTTRQMTPAPGTVPDQMERVFGST